MEARIENLETKMGRVEVRLDSIDDKLVAIDQRFDRMDRKLDGMTETILGAMDRMYKDLSSEMKILATTKVSYHDFFALENRVDKLEKEREDE